MTKITMMVQRDPGTERETETGDYGQRTVIGQPPHGHWVHCSEPPSFDLTRPLPPHYPFPASYDSITLYTSSTPIIISPAKTALVIIDMQNYFLSPVLGRQADGAGNKAKQMLLDYTLPAASAAKIQVISLNVSTKKILDLDQMPASTLRNFSHLREAAIANAPNELLTGLGTDLGPVMLEDGTVIEAGRALMQNSWNADHPSDLKESLKDNNDPPHFSTCKDRTSGLWHTFTPFARFLKQKGISTLLFAGVNIDQCVGGTLQDAYYQGYDCILLTDACGTTSPYFATQCIEYNARRSWGFISDSRNLKVGIDVMLKHKETMT